MSAPCGQSIHICTARVTKLDSVGNVVSDTDNSYVTDKILTANVKIGRAHV